MKRNAPLQRKTGLAQGTKELKRTPMKPGTARLVAKKPMARGDTQLARQAAPIRSRSKKNSNPRPKTGEAELCRGQPCYLRIPGVCAGGTDTTVPCHSNQNRHGKGRGIKAHDKFTAPGCWRCHAILDQGAQFTREEKFALWDDAYALWEPVRALLMLSAVKGKRSPLSSSVAP